MGSLQSKILPSSSSVCLCCPALQPSSQRPVKKYKKLLAEIFPKTPDDTANERKIIKLCEYAAKNPFRIQKIVKFLEQRTYRELRSEHVNFVRIITEVYCKLLYICKDQMAYFSSSMLNVIFELLDNKKQEAVQIIGCQTLTRFIYSQADNTCARNIESLICKVCTLACEKQDEHKNLLRASSLQCLSAMVWFMTEYSCIFADFDEIIHAVLDNYRIDEIEDTGETREARHNWVDEVVKSEARSGKLVGHDVGLSNMTIRPRPESKNSSILTREERESPQVWSQICIQKLAELAKESTTMRLVLDPMFIYFDKGKHWAPRHGLALCVLSDLSYLVKSSGTENLILAATIRHLDHKNVYDPQIKSYIVQIATSLIRQLSSRAGVAEITVASDLCRHLRKSLQTESVGQEESNWNISLQNSIEDCLFEIVKGIGNAQPLYDMMTRMLEKFPVVAIVAKATIESLLILSHIISLTCSHSRTQLVFPEALLLQLLKTMMHPDVETRVVAHKIFSVILVRTPNHSNDEQLYGTGKWQTKTTSTFASATALLEKLRREKESQNGYKQQNNNYNDVGIKDMGDDELKHGLIRKGSPYFYKLSSSIIDWSTTATSSDEAEENVIILSEDQTAQLLSAFWMQANQPDNLPTNFEAIAHSFSLTLLSSRIKNSNHCNIVRFFQLPLSLISISLSLNGTLPPSCKRLLFTLAISMLAFAGRLYHITKLTEALKVLISYDVDPYIRTGDDLQIFIKPQTDLKQYGSDRDQEAATSSLADLRKILPEFVERMLDIIAQDLSILTDLEKDELAKQLSETFTPVDEPLFGPKPILDLVGVEALACDESFSFDEEQSRSSSIDIDVTSESMATDIPRSVSRISMVPSFPHILSVGQLLDSALHVAGQVAGTSVSTSPLPYGTMASQCEALGMGTRKKLSTWLVVGHDSIPEYPLVDSRFGELRKMDAYGSEPRLALRLPPASPFDNFMRAAGC